MIRKSQLCENREECSRQREKQSKSPVAGMRLAGSIYEKTDDIRTY